MKFEALEGGKEFGGIDFVLLFELLSIGVSDWSFQS